MVKLYVFEKATNKVVAVIQGPDAVSCEHMAGHVDEHGQQPYCSESLGWAYEGNVDFSELNGLDLAPTIEAHPFDPNKPAGSPGGPHRMTQEQFDEQIRRQRAEHAELAALHGLKVKV